MKIKEFYIPSPPPLSLNPSPPLLFFSLYRSRDRKDRIQKLLKEITKVKEQKKVEKLFASDLLQTLVYRTNA
jgi:hypothetical protein